MVVEQEHTAFAKIPVNRQPFSDEVGFSLNFHGKQFAMTKFRLAID